MLASLANKLDGLELDRCETSNECSSSFLDLEQTISEETIGEDSRVSYGVGNSQVSEWAADDIVEMAGGIVVVGAM
jgi:hypothetical protein